MNQPHALTPIDGPAAWKGPKLAQSDGWIYQLSVAETVEIERVVAALRRMGKPRHEITREDVDIDVLALAASATCCVCGLLRLTSMTATSSCAAESR